MFRPLPYTFMPGHLTRILYRREGCFVDKILNNVRLRACTGRVGRLAGGAGGGGGHHLMHVLVRGVECETDVGVGGRRSCVPCAAAVQIDGHPHGRRVHRRHHLAPPMSRVHSASAGREAHCKVLTAYCVPKQDADHCRGHRCRQTSLACSSRPDITSALLCGSWCCDRRRLRGVSQQGASPPGGGASCPLPSTCRPPRCSATPTWRHTGGEQQGGGEGRTPPGAQRGEEQHSWPPRAAHRSCPAPPRPRSPLFLLPLLPPCALTAGKTLNPKP